MTTRTTPTPVPADDTRLIERPDGFYWQAPDGAPERGPFATLVEANAYREVFDEEELEVGESLEEAESEIGMADWIDPETGQPAEEEVSRIEEH